jgi:hypothetical protein
VRSARIVRPPRSARAHPVVSSRQPRGEPRRTTAWSARPVLRQARDEDFCFSFAIRSHCPHAVRPTGNPCEGATGTRVPYRQPWGRYHPAREALVGSLPGNPVGLPETLLGSLGLPCGTRVTAFSAPAASSNGRSMGVTVGGRPADSWNQVEPQHGDLSPVRRPLPRRLLLATSRRGQGPGDLNTAGARGDKCRRAHCARMVNLDLPTKRHPGASRTFHVRAGRACPGLDRGAGTHARFNLLSGASGHDLSAGRLSTHPLPVRRPGALGSRLRGSDVCGKVCATNWRHPASCRRHASGMQGGAHACLTQASPRPASAAPARCRR